MDKEITNKNLELNFNSPSFEGGRREDNIILKAENISKQYRLGQVGTGTMSHDLNRWWHQIRGKEDPYLKIGDTNDRSTKGASDYVWALQDINFEVKRGEVLGIIGKNGAGKSTLLKILSKVTAPTTGSIKSRGRIASLLEVGTGFNGEMTGRENIFLNGAILGMTKKEITSKLDEIIDFSGCERYIDTPVKRYSSGMTVRLAFAVAAFLEPEILVIDEVLAVGDAEFQKKAIGKMQDISKGEGRTVLFVSHSMASIRKLCNTGIVLQNGKIVYQNSIEKVVDYYENNLLSNKKILEVIYDIDESLSMQIVKVNLINEKVNKIFNTTDEIIFEIDLISRESVEGAYVTIDLKDRSDDLVYWSGDYLSERFINKINGEIKMKCFLPRNILTSGVYNVSFAIYSPIWGVVHNEDAKIIDFEIEESSSSYLGQFNINYPGKIGVISSWKVIEVVKNNNGF